MVKAETGEVPGMAIFDRIHFSDYPTPQELVDKSLQIKKACWTSSWH